MWSLKYPSSDELTEYKNRLIKSLIHSVSSCGNQLIKNTLLPSRPDGTKEDSLLISLLTYKPQELYNLNNQLMCTLILHYDDSEFDAYLRANAADSLYLKYHNILKSLSDIFNYKDKISENKSRSYMIAQMKGHDSCTYCNRQYTQTIVRDGGKNDGNRIARPQLDHWFSQQLFPLMSLSFFNLIPSCSLCNSTAKGNAIFRFQTHIHPYLKTDPTLGFNFNYRAGVNNKWELFIENDTDIREKNMIDAFHLREVYAYHSQLELKDIMDFAYGHNETYLDTLFNQILIKFPNKTKEDIYCMFFGAKMHEKDFLDRPMSKLKCDILEKVGVMDKLRNV